MSDRDLSKYRSNVGAALFNADGRVFIARRTGQRHAYAWQMPQGGLDAGETPDDAAVRELAEETGVTQDKVVRLGAVGHWLVYDFPPEVRAAQARTGRDWVGQKQRWFAFRFTGRDEDIELNADDRPEFDAWRWEQLAVVPSLVIPWKRLVYEEVVAAFARFASPSAGADAP